MIYWLHLSLVFAFTIFWPIIEVSADTNDTLGFYYLMNYHFASRTNRSSIRNRTAVQDHSPLIVGAVDTVSFNISNSDQALMYEVNQINDFYAEQLHAISRDPKVAKVVNASFHIHHHHPRPGAIHVLDNSDGADLDVQISGHRLGRTVIDVMVIGYSTADSLNNAKNILNHKHAPRRESRMLASFDITVVRRTIYKKLGRVFTITVAIMSVFTTFLIGTKLDWKIVLNELKKPKSLLIGCGLEFLIMPLIAFAWAFLIFKGNNAWQLVYLAIGACPGSGHSPFWTLMLDGNLDLAVAMSFVASVAALGILPFWIFTLGRIFYAGHFTIPYHAIIGSLFGLICPIFFGLLAKRFFPSFADRMGKAVKHVTVASFIVLAIFGCAVNWYVFALLDWRHVVCGFLLPWCGYAITYPLSRWIFRRSHQDSIAIAVENGCLNVAVPTVLIQLTLAQPDSDLSLVVPVGVVIFATLPLWIHFLILVIKKRKAMPTVPVGQQSGAVENSKVEPGQKGTHGDRGVEIYVVSTKSAATEIISGSLGSEIGLRNDLGNN